MSPTDETTDVLIVGAGPYGLAIASYLSFLEMEYRIVGSPMSLWRSHMRDELLRSTLAHTCPSNPEGTQLLDSWVASHVSDVARRPIATLFPNELLEFMAYFMRHFDIAAEDDLVQRVVETNDGFLCRLASGKQIRARQVVLAIGVAGAEHYPDWASNERGAHGLTHSSMPVEQAEWRGSRVLIVGGGQSAAEAAIQAASGGAASVELVFRAHDLTFNSMHSEFTAERKRRLFRVKHAFLYGGPDYRRTSFTKLLPVSVEPHLRSALENHVVIRGGCEVSSLRSSRGAFEIAFQDGAHRTYERVICATGYRPSLPELPIELHTSTPLLQLDRLPDLSECAQTSCEGLFMVGAWSAARFGPQANFIYGSQQIVPRLVGRLARFDR